MPIGQPAVYPDGYSPRRHRNHLSYVHGVVLIRRAALAPVLDLLRTCGCGAEAVLTARLARIDAPLAPERMPVHVPIVGRLWRQHAGGYHLAMTDADRARVQQAVGVKPQYLHVRAPAAPVPCAACAAPWK